MIYVFPASSGWSLFRGIQTSWRRVEMSESIEWSLVRAEKHWSEYMGRSDWLSGWSCSDLIELLHGWNMLNYKYNDNGTMIGWEGKNEATVICKTGRFDNIESAAILSSVSKAVQNSTDDDSWICDRNVQFYELLYLYFSSLSLTGLVFLQSASTHVFSVISKKWNLHVVRGEACNGWRAPRLSAWTTQL